MLALAISLIVLISGLVVFTRYTYILGRDGVETGVESRRYMSFIVSSILVILLAAFLNKAIE
jgi:branched-subunit amino acid transport protein